MKLSATAILTRPATTPTYTANDVVGDVNGSGILTFRGFDPNRGLIITDVSLLIGLSAVPASMSSGFRLHFYNQLPTAVADDAAFDIADTNDNDGYEDFATIAQPTDMGSRLFVKERGLNIAVQPAANGDVYAKLVTIGALVAAASTVYRLKVYGVPVL